LLICLPFILSRILVWFKKRFSIRYDFKEIANIAFSLTFYISVSLSAERILSSLSSVIYVFIIAVVSSFGLGLLLILIGKKIGINKKDFALYALFGTLKNGNLALGICILLFSPISFIPAAVMSAVHVAYIAFLLWFFKKI
jgi:hypothetical protein